MTDDSNRDFSDAVNQSPGMNEREGVRRPISFIEAMDVVERGFKNWMAKPHNRKWLRRIEGTPIPNDIAVNIAEAICDSTLSSTPRAPAPSAWQPIETAPRGAPNLKPERILLLLKDGRAVTGSPCWSNVWGSQKPGGGCDVLAVVFGGFCEEEGGAFIPRSPTHWMHLPSLPSSDRGGVG